MASFLESILNAIWQASQDLTISLAAGSSVVTFPVLPSELMVSVNTNHGTVNINNYGEYLMKGRTGLKSLTLAGFFPAQDYPFAMMTMSPYTYIAELEAIHAYRRRGLPAHGIGYAYFYALPDQLLQVRGKGRQRRCVL